METVAARVVRRCELDRARLSRRPTQLRRSIAGPKKKADSFSAVNPTAGILLPRDEAVNRRPAIKAAVSFTQKSRTRL